MQRLSSYKDKSANRQTAAKNLNIMIPGVREPAGRADILDLPRFRSNHQNIQTKYYSSDKAKQSAVLVNVEQFVLHKRPTEAQDTHQRKEQEELHKIRKSENLSHNKYRSSSEVEIARARRSLHIKQQKDTEQGSAQRANTRSQKVLELKPNSLSLPHKSKESPHKSSMAARYNLTNDDEQDQKWAHIQRQRIAQKNKKVGMNKLVTQGLQKQQPKNTKIVTEITDNQVRIRKKSENKIRQSRKMIERQPIQLQSQSREEEQKVNSLDSQIATDNTVIELPYFFIIEDIHLNLYQNLKNNTNIYDLCLCYINLQKIANQRVVYTLLTDSKQVNLVRNVFLLERLIVFLIIYVEKWKNKKRRFILQLTDLARFAYTNYSTLIELLLEIMQEQGKLDQKVFRPKELGKQKKFKEFARSNIKIKNTLSQILQSKQLPLFELFLNLLQSSVKLDSIEFINVVDKTLKWQVLTMPSYPFLPPACRELTLIVDLDQTLIHFNEKESVVHERAYVSEFLQRMSRLYEIVIFTAGTKAYADSIIDSIDTEHCISFRLYRNHITLHEGAPIKDLSKLGRDLSKMLIIDNLSSNFRLQPDNGILISSWYGEQSDDVLLKLCNVLKNIHSKFQHDLREGVKHWAQYIREQISYNRLIYEMKQEL